MDINTLLTKQMELHTTLRRVPKTPEMLLELCKEFQEYQYFLNKLRQFARRLSTETDAVFQYLVYSSLNDASSLSRHQRDNAMQRRQAKVLASEKAMKLESSLLELVPREELMGYAELGKRLHNVFRMKTEDRNDLQKVEKLIAEAIEYLNFLRSRSGGDAQAMFSLFMAEGAEPLVAMLRARGDNVTGAELTTSFGEASRSAFYSSTFSRRDSGLPPSSPTTFTNALATKCAVAGDVRQPAGERLHCAQTIVNWIAGVPAGVLERQLLRFIPSLAPCLDTLIEEMRSSLCRLGCEAAMILVRRTIGSPGSAEDSLRTLGSTLGQWSATLTRRVFVTVVAISTAADLALRELVLCSRAHLAVVRSILSALEKGTQVELRRKCLGYLVLSLVSANESAAVRRLGYLLAEPAQKYVLIGDTKIRKMSRALCIALGEICRVELNIDEKTVRFMQQEKQDLLPFLNSPRDLEKILFGPRKEIFSSHPIAQLDPEGDIKLCYNDHQVDKDARSSSSYHPLCRVASRVSRPQLPSINRSQLPDIMKTSKTQSMGTVMDGPRNSFSSNYSKLLTRRRGIYDTEADLFSTVASGSSGTSLAEERKFALEVPKWSATALPEAIAMRKAIAEPNTANTLSQNLSGITPPDTELSSLDHMQSSSTTLDLSDATNIPQRPSSGGTGASTRIVPLSLACTPVRGGDVDHVANGTRYRSGVTHGESTHVTQIEYPEPRLSNTLRRKIDRLKP